MLEFFLGKPHIFDPYTQGGRKQPIVGMRFKGFCIPAKKNNLIDTSVQKVGIDTGDKEKKDLHVVFLDLASAFGSVLHEVL